MGVCADSAEGHRRGNARRRRRRDPDDYKFFVFHGKCAFVQVDSGRFGRRTQDFFRSDWQHMPLSGGPPWADPEPAKPARLTEMIGVAERLGADTDFVRVDLPTSTGASSSAS